MTVDGDIAAKGILRFYREVIRRDMRFYAGGIPYRDPLAEEKLLPVASHPKDRQRLLP
jgi:hypothetical protein